MQKANYNDIKEMFKQRGYELLSTEYMNCQEPLRYICNKHRSNGVQDIDFAHFKQGQGCKYCGQENKRNGKEKPLSEYNAKDVTESKGMEFVKITRENSVLYVYYICPKHRDVGIQKTTLESMRRKKIGCPYCIGRNKTTADFIQEIAKIHSNIEILGEYVSATDKILCRCKIDQTEWLATPNNLLHGTGCPECGKVNSNKSRTKSHDQFLSELKAKNIQVTPLTQYAQAKSPMLFRCNICGYSWTSSPDNVLQNGNCPECTKRKLHNIWVKSDEQFRMELSLVNPQLVPMETYVNDYTKIKVKCLKHDYVWEVSPNKILHKKTGCPKCAIYSNEEKIFDILVDFGYNPILQKRFSDCKDKNTLPFDLYVEDLNLLIEYQGEQHYKPIPHGSMTLEDAIEQFKITQKHDKIKKDYCEKNNIVLVCIPYWENKNIKTILVREFQSRNFPILTQQKMII